MARSRFERLRGFVSRLPEAVDEAIFAVAPTWGARRIAVRRQMRLAKQAEAIVNRAFSGAENDRTHAGKWLGSRLSPDSELELDHRALQERCDELYRDNEIAHGAIEGRVANEIGTGIIPQARVEATAAGDDQERAKAVNNRLEENCRRWSENGIDRSGCHSLYAAQQQWCRTFASLGEVFLELGSRGRPRGDSPIDVVCESIHPFRIATPPQRSGDPNCRMGVQMAESGEVQGYWVQRTHPYDTRKLDILFDFVPRFDAAGQPRMLHVFEPLFPGQHRGLPWLAASINRIKDVKDVVEYTIVAMQIEACFAAFIKNEDGPTPHQLATATADGTDGSGNRVEELRPGAIEYLGRGQSVDFANPQRPGSTFLPMVEWSLRSIAASLNYPYELLAQNFARVTYSSGRLSMHNGRLGFNVRRQSLVEHALAPLWKHLVWHGVMAGTLADLITALEFATRSYNYTRHVWQARSAIIHVNPEQEFKAHKLAIDENMKTLSSVWAEEGGDMEQGLTQRGREKEIVLTQHTELEAMQTKMREKLGLPPLPAGFVAGIDEIRTNITETGPVEEDVDPDAEVGAEEIVAEDDEEAVE